jgi:glycosyltransferase involved in cell wall biosynthesis
MMLPTFNSAETIERTLRSALAQRHRPLEVVVYDEASKDGTVAIVQRLLDDAPDDIETRLLSADHNSGPVRAWRVPLHAVTGDWCAFVWADDVLAPMYSEAMMAGAARAEDAGRHLVACSGWVESGGSTRPYYSDEPAVLTACEYSEAIFTRRLPLSQICAVYPVEAARRIFDRHIAFDNPLGVDYNRFPYGNDVGFLSELAADGAGVELVGGRLVTLVDSSSSMTRRGGREHVWQMRWQYTFNQHRVWSWWAQAGVQGTERLRRMSRRRLALCGLILGATGDRARPRAYVDAPMALVDYWRFDYQRDKHSLAEHRRRARRSLGTYRTTVADRPHTESESYLS